jgi:hypothetical protein
LMRLAKRLPKGLSRISPNGLSRISPNGSSIGRHNGFLRWRYMCFLNGTWARWVELVPQHGSAGMLRSINPAAPFPQAASFSDHLLVEVAAFGSRLPRRPRLAGAT